MSEVLRYRQCGGDAGYAIDEMMLHSQGEWVPYVDYEQLGAFYANECARNIAKEIAEERNEGCMSVCELAEFNTNVRDYMGHWEGRAVDAESRVKMLEAILQRVLSELKAINNRSVVEHEAHKCSAPAFTTVGG